MVVRYLHPRRPHHPHIPHVSREHHKAKLKLRNSLGQRASDLESGSFARISLPTGRGRNNLLIIDPQVLVLLLSMQLFSGNRDHEFGVDRQGDGSIVRAQDFVVKNVFLCAGMRRVLENYKASQMN